MLDFLLVCGKSVLVVAYRYCSDLAAIDWPEVFAAWPIGRFYQDFELPGLENAAVKAEVKTSVRSQLAQLLSDCGEVSAGLLLVETWAELGDSMVEVERVLADCQAIGLKVCALSDGPKPLTNRPPTPNSGGAGDQIANFNEFQKQLRSRSIQQGHARNRLQALPPPGRVPFGYIRSAQCYVIDPVAAPIVKALFDQFLLFGSVRGAVRYLKQNFGKVISPSTALRWLTSPVYRGHLDYATGDVIRNTHDAIVSSDEAAQVDRLLQRNRRVPKRAASSGRSLSGLVICKTCQSSMTVASVSARKKSKPTYLYLRPTDCKACELGLGKKCGAIGYDEVLKAVIDQICTALPRAIAPLPVDQLKQVSERLEQQILNKQKILEQIPELEINQVLDSETAMLRSYKLRAEIAVLQASQSRLPPTNLVSIAETVSIPAFWDDLSEPERRFYLREFLRRVEWVRSPSSVSPQGWTIELVFTF